MTDLTAAADSGNEIAQSALQDTARLIGIAAANIATVVDPSVIVLGGSMFAQAERLVELVRSVVRKLARTNFDVVLSELGKEAPLAGCLLVAAHEARTHLRQRFSRSPAMVEALQ